MTELKAACFDYDEDGPGRYTIMVVEMSDVTRQLERAGWRDGHKLYFHMNGGIQKATDKYVELANRLSAHDDDMLLEVLRGIDRGNITLEQADGTSFSSEGVLLD